MHNLMILAPEAAAMLFEAAAAKGILKGRREALLERLEGMARDLFPTGTNLFASLLSSLPGAKKGPPPASGFEGLRLIGSRFLALRGAGRDETRQAGRFYTPVWVIDRIVDSLWDILFPDGGFDARAAKRVCDPAMGCAFFPLRLAESVVARFAPGAADLRAWAAASLYGVDNDPFAVFMGRALLWLALSDRNGEFVPDPARFVCGEALLGNGFGAGTKLSDAAGSVDWAAAFPEVAADGGFDAIFGNPPYEVLTNFVSAPGRRELADAIRASGLYADALRGQINLYRCFVERSLSLLRPGGGLGMIVPLSLARDASAAGLRRRLLGECRAAAWLLFGEDDGVFPGVTQSACIFRATRDGGRAERVEIRVGDGPPMTMALRELEAFGDSLSLPTLGPEGMALLRWFREHCPHTLADAATLRVGEVDQTVFRACFRDQPTGCLLARGAHVSPFFFDADSAPAKERYLDRERFLAMKGAMAADCRERASRPRVAQLGIRNMHARPRLVAAILPAGVYAGNSLNIYYPRENLPPEYLAGMLNSRILDWLFRSGSGNNNINLHEMRILPFPAFPEAGQARAVAQAYAEGEKAAAGGKTAERDLADIRTGLDRAAAACYGLPEEMLEKLLNQR